MAAQQEATAGEQAAAAAELEAREADLGTQGAALESSAGQLGSQEATLTQRQACLLLCSAPPGPVSVYFARICASATRLPASPTAFLASTLHFHHLLQAVHTLNRWTALVHLICKHVHRAA